MHPILGILRGELFPTEIRTTASGIVLSTSYMVLMVNFKFFPSAVESLGFHYVMYFYAVITAVLAVWAFLTIKNTDQLTLAEIQEMHKKAEAADKVSKEETLMLIQK